MISAARLGQVFVVIEDVLVSLIHLLTEVLCVIVVRHLIVSLSSLNLINLLQIVRESFLRLNDLHSESVEDIWVMSQVMPVDMLSSHCLTALITR